ncbi:hypothetical protein [Caproiciproducens galactitolivorans]|uniref:ABC-2 family transporter protein n=1 Tax=Caproiciproducens galactitolivorans TaxID=642589 RepID=A0ABT4BUR8_9FIRM|nr:hypothetical protein [Caproiciproducens galactitolivorans]MCY1714540.1 hypothetical protein [Caproiciproducens galactitolivorans]
MLRKLLRYEIKATSRTFLPMYALLIVFALINKFFMAVNSSYLKIPQAIAMSVFVFIIIGICVMTLVVTIQRFNKNLLTDEGYLSFTLPVRVHSHIDSKMIVTLMWSVLSVLVSLISIFVMSVNETTILSFQRFMNELMAAFSQIGPSGYVLILEAVLLVIFGILSSTVEIYAAITVGNMSSKHKLLTGIGAYLGFGVIQQIIVSIILSSSDKSITRYFNLLETAGEFAQVQAAETVLLVLIAYMVIVGVALYFFTEWMLRKKLNLE